jgi:hypothetical protein
MKLSMEMQQLRIELDFLSSTSPLKDYNNAAKFSLIHGIPDVSLA